MNLVSISMRPCLGNAATGRFHWPLPGGNIIPRKSSTTSTSWRLSPRKNSSANLTRSSSIRRGQLNASRWIVTPNATRLLDYPTKSVEEIEEMNLVEKFAADNCHVFLWTTQRFLPAAIHILEKWGVKYGFTMVWHKNGGPQPLGLPAYNCEYCLYGRVGSPVFVDTKDFATCFAADRTRHSEKPERFYEIICRVTAGRRLDCYNRRKIERLTGWGNDAK